MIRSGRFGKQFSVIFTKCTERVKKEFGNFYFSFQYLLPVIKLGKEPLLYSEISTNFRVIRGIGSITVRLGKVNFSRS